MKSWWPVLALTTILSGCMGTEPDRPNPKLEALSANGGDFGQTLIGAGKQVQYKLINDGSGFTAVETLRDIVITGSGTGISIDRQDCGATLEENASCVIVVSYDPVAAGTLSGQLQVSSNADGDPLRATLTGTATATLSPARGVVQLVGTPSRVFAVARGSSATRSYTFVNQGNAGDTLTITGPGAGATDWALANGCTGTLAVGATCTVDVTYQPASDAVATTLRLVVSDAYNQDYGQLVIELSGVPQ